MSAFAQLRTFLFLDILPRHERSSRLSNSVIYWRRSCHGGVICHCQGVCDKTCAAVYSKRMCVSFAHGRLSLLRGSLQLRSAWVRDRSMHDDRVRKHPGYRAYLMALDEAVCKKARVPLTCGHRLVASSLPIANIPLSSSCGRSWRQLIPGHELRRRHRPAHR